jgi:hypothetical protein
MAGPRFDGKVALSPARPAARRAAAVRFATEGARVGLVDVSRDGLRESLAAVEKAGGTGLTVEADVTRAADVARYAATVAERFGGIDCFFNNAGILGAVRPLVDYPEDVFDRVLASTSGRLARHQDGGAAARARGGGVIVNTASIAGLRGSRNLVALHRQQARGGRPHPHRLARADCRPHPGQCGLPEPDRHRDGLGAEGPTPQPGRLPRALAGTIPLSALRPRRRWRRWWPSCAAPTPSTSRAASTRTARRRSPSPALSPKGRGS